jgi:ABC-type transport system involved in multi-copper enzyme maturation permease subunit
MNATPRGPAKTGFFLRRWRVRELAVVIVLAGLPAAAAQTGLSWLLTFETGFLALGGVIVLVLMRGDWTLAGPHFYYDLVSLARRGRSTGVRVFYLTALLASLTYIYHEAFGQKGQFMLSLFEPGPSLSNLGVTSFAHRFVDVVVIFQNLAVLLLVPPYVGSAMTEERDHHTLELLFTTQLHDREIVLGKLTARIVHLGGVVLSALPILSIVQLLGGVSMPVLLANFANTALLLTAAASLSMLISVQSKSTLEAVIGSYAVIIVGSGWSIVTWSSAGGHELSPLLMSQGHYAAGQRMLLESIGLRLLIFGGLSVFFIATAVRSLRREPRVPYGKPGVVRHENIDKRARTEKSPSAPPLPQIVGDPLLWKERNVGGIKFTLSSFFFVLAGAWLALPTCILLLGTVIELRSFQWMKDQGTLAVYRFLFRTMLLPMAAIFCLAVGLRASASVAFERQKGTLDGLLTLPVSNIDVLKAKWHGALLQDTHWMGLYVLAACVAVAIGAIHFIGGILMILSPLAVAAFFGSLGLYISIVARSVLAAQIRIILVMLLMLAITLLRLEWYLPEGVFFDGALNPLRCWYFLCSDPKDSTEVIAHDPGLAAILLGMTGFAGAAICFWLLACRAFEKEWRVPRTDGKRI